MTLQECKDQVAKIKGADDWEECMNKQLYRTIRLSHDEAAELYAQSQVNEAVQKSINLINEHKAFGLVDANFLIEELKKLKL